MNRAEKQTGVSRRRSYGLFIFFGAPLFILSGGFSHLAKVQLVRFSMVTFSGSRLQIFLHCLFAHLLKNPSAQMNRDTPLSKKNKREGDER